jgi:hypothetical protein
MSAREKLRALVERLPDDQVENVLRMVEAVRREEREDPVWAILQSVPEDDEPLTDEERQALDEGLDDLARGHTIPWEKVREELG